jgi:hypothetical protein
MCCGAIIKQNKGFLNYNTVSQSDNQGGNLYSVGMLNKGMIFVPGQMECDSMRFHYAIWNGTQLKTYTLLISGIFHLMFLDHD